MHQLHRTIKINGGCKVQIIHRSQISGGWFSVSVYPKIDDMVTWMMMMISSTSNGA